MPRKRASKKAKSGHVFGQLRKRPKMLRAGLYARVSTNDQQTLAMQNRAMREYAARRGWTIALQVREVNSGATRREAREKLLEAARRRAGLATGSLGPLGDRSAGDASGTGASRSGFRFLDRSAGSDDSGRASDGCHARSLRQLRTGGLAGTDSGGPGPRSNEWQETGSADDRRAPSCRNTKAAPRRHQQIGNRPPAEHRTNFRPPHPGDG